MPIVRRTSPAPVEPRSWCPRRESAGLSDEVAGREPSGLGLVVRSSQRAAARPRGSAGDRWGAPSWPVAARAAWRPRGERSRRLDAVATRPRSRDGPEVRRPGAAWPAPWGERGCRRDAASGRASLRRCCRRRGGCAARARHACPREATEGRWQRAARGTLRPPRGVRADAAASLERVSSRRCYECDGRSDRGWPHDCIVAFAMRRRLRRTHSASGAASAAIAIRPAASVT